MTSKAPPSKKPKPWHQPVDVNVQQRNAIPRVLDVVDFASVHFSNLKF
jgi:hypothetical protein